MVRSLLPTFDPVRRSRVRRAARSLVDCDPWPEDDVTVGGDVAKLALVNLLYLQRETRRAASSGGGEAAVRLARSSIETCLLGMYALTEPSVVGQLKGGQLKNMRAMLAYLVDAGMVTQEIIDQSAAAMGPVERMPTVYEMASRIDSTTSGDGAVSLYRRFYVPTSALFVHTNAASLLRYVGRAGALRRRPSFPWVRQSAVRVSDACVGVLSAAVASSVNKPTSMFTEYAEAHLPLALTPVGVIVARRVSRSVPLTQLPAMVRAGRELRRYAASPQAATDPPQGLEARLTTGFDQLFQPLMSDLPDDVVRLLRAWFIDLMTDAITKHAQRNASAVPAS